MTGQVQKAKPIIRKCTEADRDHVLEIARELAAAADTYAFDPDVSEEALWSYWNPSKGGQGFIAEVDGRIAGIFVIKRNQPGPASHIANASYAVRKNARGLGIGRLMGEQSLDLARELGFQAMQFNIVLANNTAAIRAWQSIGFEIIGTIPEGFRSPDGTYVDFHIMYLKL